MALEVEENQMSVVFLKPRGEGITRKTECPAQPGAVAGSCVDIRVTSIPSFLFQQS